jgi:hypothetical protein
MGTQKAKRHTHKYRLVRMGNTMVWACGQSDCNHYMPPNMEAMVEGKKTECWDCGKETIMSVERMEFGMDMNEGRVLCENCMNKRQGIEIPISELEELSDIDTILAKMRKRS